MLQKTCCSICLTLNKRTINIYGTHLQNVYEKLAEFEAKAELCYLCYICCARLRQVANLQNEVTSSSQSPKTLVCLVIQNIENETIPYHVVLTKKEPLEFDVQERRLEPDDVTIKPDIENSEYVECWVCYICHTRLRQCQQLQQLAVQTRGLIDDIIQKKMDVKFEPFGSLLQLSTTKTKVTDRTYKTSSIKQESDLQIAFNNKNGSRHEAENTQYELEVEGLSVESEDPLVNTQLPTNIVDDSMSLKRSQSTIEDTSSICPVDQPAYLDKEWEAEIKLEVEGVEDQSTEQDYELDNTNHGRRDHTSETQSSKHTRGCDVCYKKFKFKSDLLRHMRIHSNVKPFGCDICSRKFKSRHCLQRHMRIHIGDLPYGCHICPKKYLFECDLQRHVRSHRSEELNNLTSNENSLYEAGEDNVCNFCSKKFTNKGSLNRHIRIHTGDKPFVCHVCAKKFIEKSALDNHVLTHTGTKPFSCDICSKRFTLKLNLKRHSVVHTAKTQFNCDICTKKFRFKSTLKSHRRLHGGARIQERNKPYSCDVCSEKFSHQRYLNAHAQIHASDKVFSCELCPKKFLRKTHLNRHSRSHTGDQPFTCDICARKFTQKGSLKVHKRSHEGDRKYSCHICSKKFLRNYTLQTHLKIHEARATVLSDSQTYVAQL
ncbi:zinc finger protein 62 homolog isoform X1 [Aricia agestis]|uniref:zinc finger protein 62 homolog isoform X1 n=1 Tax=Aricia agestis TaxID=91739 RepID=UPI001C2040D2|nr:zinc finger protein 62 homolog isoform X1 [Aricia agestis]